MDLILLDIIYKKFYKYFVDIRLYIWNFFILVEMGFIIFEGIKVWSIVFFLKIF